MSATKTSRVTFIHRPNRLKAKVCGSESGGPGMVAPELLSQAEAVVARYSADYPAQAEADLSQLAAALAAALAAPAECAAEIRRLRSAAREIMGQAETFGYPLLTRFARSLYDFCDGMSAISDKQGAVLQAHVDAIGLILRGRMSGDGGRVGAELAQSLAIAGSRFAAAQ